LLLLSFLGTKSTFLVMQWQVDRHIQRLDEDLAKIEAELRAQRSSEEKSRKSLPAISLPSLPSISSTPFVFVVCRES